MGKPKLTKLMIDWLEENGPWNNCIFILSQGDNYSQLCVYPYISYSFEHGEKVTRIYTVNQSDNSLSIKVRTEPEGNYGYGMSGKLSGLSVSGKPFVQFRVDVDGNIEGL